MVPGIEPRLHRQRLAGGEGQGFDPRRLAGADEGRPVLGAVFGERDEETAGVLDAVGGDPPEDPVFGDALPGGFGIVDGVAAAAVEEALVPCRRRRR